MTDRKKSKRKVEFGADEEADRILEKLPRAGLRVIGLHGKAALLSIDASGRLLIAIDGGGLLILDEKNLAYLHGDELADF